MKKIVVNENKCTACLTCEVACSLHNAKEINPKKSMIRVRVEGDQYIPVIAASGKDEENTWRHMFFDESVECNYIGFSNTQVHINILGYFEAPFAHRICSIRCDYAMVGGPPGLNSYSLHRRLRITPRFLYYST